MSPSFFPLAALCNHPDFFVVIVVRSSSFVTVTYCLNPFQYSFALVLSVLSSISLSNFGLVAYSLTRTLALFVVVAVVSSNLSGFLLKLIFSDCAILYNTFTTEFEILSLSLFRSYLDTEKGY